MGSSPVDLHLHSVFSAGSLTPGQLELTRNFIRWAAQQKL